MRSRFRRSRGALAEVANARGWQPALGLPIRTEGCALPHVVIDTFNPYSARYPNRRVLSLHGLFLYKLLRQQGIDVRISGNPQHEVNYLITRGLEDWLSNPVNLLLVGVPLQIACGWLANALPKLGKRHRQPTDVLLELDEDGKGAHYTCQGTPLTDAQFTSLLTAMNDRRHNHAHAGRIPIPYPDRRTPLFLEHTGRVVGWAKVVLDDVGLKVDDAVVTDAETMRRIKDGSLKGFSIGGLVRQAKCSNCGGSFIECEHIPNLVTLTEVDLGEISIVAHPAYSLADVKVETGEEEPG
jgi:hypothetical protein